uniref:RING-type domain-containing protein n=1 Tax=Panagrolaimus superbus TaxID=310955 RepID=A0A914Z301_9BILA
MAKVNEKYVLNSSSESEVDTSESEVDLSDDDMEGQKIKPEINGKTSSDNNSSVFLKSNNKLQATTSSSKTAAATNSKPQNIKFVETSSSSEDVSDSSEDEMVQMKSDIKNNINGKQSSTNIPKIIGVGSIPPKIAPKQPVSINKTSSEDESDSDETFSSDDDEITVPRQKQKVNNKAAVQNFSKLNIVKTDETSEDTSDTSDSESDKTSSSDEDDDDNDASDEEEDETDDSESVVVESKNAAQILKKPAPNTVTLPQSKTTLTKFNNDETDEDYTSTEESEDEVFVKKPLTTKPFQTDSDSDSDEDPDYSDNSSEDDNIPIKKNDQASSTKAIIPPKVTTNMAPPKPPPRVTIPFQNPFSSIRATSQIAPTTIKQQTRKTQQQPPLEDNLLLNALRQFSLNLNNPVERQKELARRAEEAFRRNELTFVCCVCMENFYRDANFAKCKKLNGEKIKVDHYICITCLRGTATPENAGIAPDGSGLKCPFPECPNILLMSEIRGMIDAGIESNLLELIGRMSFASADIGILVTYVFIYI